MIAVHLALSCYHYLYRGVGLQQTFCAAVVAFTAFTAFAIASLAYVWMAFHQRITCAWFIACRSRGTCGTWNGLLAGGTARCLPSRTVAFYKHLHSPRVMYHACCMLALISHVRRCAGIRRVVRMARCCICLRRGTFILSRRWLLPVGRFS
jgi:hypothetical protein